VDLHRASLLSADLLSADLRGPNLIGANLSRANLSGANLSGANLNLAGLNLAALSGANLSGANLIGANLSGANLIGADLSGANLIGADLSGANLREAQLFETIFGDTELTDVQGLDACEHHGPSILDHRTIAKSGRLPLAFLRGCGLPDKLIEYLPSLLNELNEAIQFYSCFISYSTKDETFAQRFHADLQNKGVRCCLLLTTSGAGKRFTSRLTRRFASTTGCCWFFPSTA